MQIIQFETLKTAEWSGGTTTELFIFPKSASYKKMDFDFRISTATIEIEQSTFTPLPGVKRTLMVLNGTLELDHKDQHSTILEAFEKDNFLGDWETTSGGIAEDFNLMIRNPDLNGFVRHLQLSKKKSLTLQTDKHGFIYIYKGTIALNDEYQLTSGDSIYFDEKDSITMQGLSNALLIYVLIE
ncbi:MAG: HutD family protein [Crocinitomicaceae bacterium]|jgi:environmental stress-induced protein Ves|nr:HutD family protein [Crocinitomicaceae bacterium]MBK9593082.1 HutD family protein [Crocinitomicaceae bacterium]